jgi:two-component system, OmpR family, sensor kinase
LPIRWRLTVFNALTIGAILLVSGFVLFLLVREALLSGVEDTVRSRASEAARSVESGGTLEGEETQRLTLDGVFVLVRDGDGGVLTQTINLPTGAKDPDSVWDRALQDDQPAEGTVEISSDAPAYIYAVPVNPESGQARVVEAGQSYEGMHKSIETFATALAAVVVCAFLLSVIGAYFLARTALSL